MQDLSQCYEEAAAFIFVAEDGSIRILQNTVPPHRKTQHLIMCLKQPLWRRSVIIHEFSAV
jgi:hypothetical protein